MKKILPKVTLSVVGLMSTLMLGGCNLAIFDPKGPVGQSEKELIMMTVGAMLCIVVPVIIATLVIARRYREANKSATYAPKWDFSAPIEMCMWGIPICLIAFLAYKTYIACHELDPYKPLAAAADNPKAKPLKVQVVALSWKWLFIYPEYGIATVNQLAVPVNTPIAFTLTSDAAMNSFWIPRLGSQVYVMAGMQTQLHLLASSEGDYLGESNNYSGRGYSDMNFRTLVKDEKGFQDWVEKVRASSQELNNDTYGKLHEDSIKNPVEYYAHVEPVLFDTIVAKYNNGMVMDKATGQMIHVSSNQSGEMKHAEE